MTVSTEDNLKQKATHYLKTHYGEDTVAMEVLNNGVKAGNGVLHVECTVSVGGSH